MNNLKRYHAIRLIYELNWEKESRQCALPFDGMHGIAYLRWLNFPFRRRIIHSARNHRNWPFSRQLSMSTTDMFHNDAQCCQAYVAKMNPYPFARMYRLDGKCMQFFTRPIHQFSSTIHSHYLRYIIVNGDHISMCAECSDFWLIVCRNTINTKVIEVEKIAIFIRLR